MAYIYYVAEKRMVRGGALADVAKGILRIEEMCRGMDATDERVAEEIDLVVSHLDAALMTERPLSGGMIEQLDPDTPGFEVIARNVRPYVRRPFSGDDVEWDGVLRIYQVGPLSDDEMVRFVCRKGIVDAPKCFDSDWRIDLRFEPRTQDVLNLRNDLDKVRRMIRAMHRAVDGLVSTEDKWVAWESLHAAFGREYVKHVARDALEYPWYMRATMTTEAASLSMDGRIAQVVVSTLMHAHKLLSKLRDPLFCGTSWDDDVCVYGSRFVPSAEMPCVYAPNAFYVTFAEVSDGLLKAVCEKWGRTADISPYVHAAAQWRAGGRASRY